MYTMNIPKGKPLTSHFPMDSPIFTSDSSSRRPLKVTGPRTDSKRRRLSCCVANGSNNEKRRLPGKKTTYKSYNLRVCLMIFCKVCLIFLRIFPCCSEFGIDCVPVILTMCFHRTCDRNLPLWRHLFFGGYTSFTSSSFSW